MKNLKKISILSISIYLLVSIIIFCWLFFIKRSLYFSLFPAVFFFFLLILIISIIFIRRALLHMQDANDKQKLFRKYITFRYIVFFITIAFFVLYFILVKEQIKTFLFVYIIYYLLYLLFQTWLFSTIANKKKK